MKNCTQQEDDAINVVTPGGGMTSGLFYVIGALYGVAGITSVAGDPNVLHREGIFTLPKAAGVWSQGDQLFWDANASNFTTVAAGNKPVGVAAVDALTGDTTGSVLLEEVPSGLANAVAGVGAGYKIARGSTSVTGATAGDVTTGLATVVSVTATLGEDASLAGNNATAALGGTAGHITLKVWKPTASGDCTPILATAAKVVNWIAVGT